MPAIATLRAQKILDSRGNWTVEAEITLKGGEAGKASVPAGASVSKAEAKVVSADKAVELIESELKEKLVGVDATDQATLDQTLIELDGTKNKSRLGANTTLAISLAACRAAANRANKPLYRYLDSLFEPKKENFFIPTPLFNVLNGGRHANNDLDFQEFIIIPSGVSGLDDQVATGVLVYHQLEKLLEEDGYSTELGDEGGFAPREMSNLDALSFLTEAITLTDLEPGGDIFLGIDAAAGELTIPSDQLHTLYLEISRDYPLEYLEDPFSEDDTGAWVALKNKLPQCVGVVGDDLTVTDSNRIEKAVEAGAISGVIIKPNQIGTLTETLKAVATAKKHNLTLVVSHRSGETSDTFIADLAVGIGANYIKTGAPARGERVAKYNRLLEIEREVVT